MALLKFPGLFQNLKTVEQITNFLTQWAQEVINQVNGRLTFVDNVRASGPFVVTFPTAATDVKVPHSLGDTPQGFIVINASAAMSVYQGSLPWTDQAVYLRASAVGNATVYFV